MDFKQNVSLADHSTMRLGGAADWLVEVNTKWQMPEAWHWAKQRDLPVIVIGHGSNIVWRDEGFHGLVIVNKITGYNNYAEDARSHYITAGAGEVLDVIVASTVEAGLTGIEALSLIPGTIGATPVQNVGAYGQEIAQTLMSVEAYDTENDKLINIPNEACGFSYRKSLFQTEYRGKYLITGITLHLRAANPEPPYYGAVQQYLEQNPVENVTPAVIRQAVIDIRNSKLPNPAEIANSGSFFANPIVSGGALVELRAAYPEMPCWPLDDGSAKIPAAWLIEQAGLKDNHDPETGMATWAKQPLVLINENAKTTADLLAYKAKIIGAVKAKFNLTLTQEPELLPLTEG